jgi:hypothetical protein
MNTRISAIATSVYALVTVMPKYSRSILSSHPSRQTPLRGNRSGTYTLRTVRNTLCTVKLILF